MRPASVGGRACTFAAVTVAVENACAASCKALAKAGERGKKAGVSQQSGSAAQQARFTGSNTL